jgi:DNA-binding HxlR family transcriptional regulator
MDSEKENLGTCPVDRGLTLIGDRWSMLVLRDIERGFARYEQLRTSLGIAPNILARRLSALTEAGLLEKHRYSARPPRDEYRLTEKGRDFLPILAAIGAWGSKHNGGGALTRQIDVETGGAIKPVVIDANTGAPIGSRPLRMEYPA